MFIKKSIWPVIVLLAAFGQAGALADATSHRQAVEKLFELTGMQQMIEDSVNNVLALQITQNSDLQEHEIVVREFLERHIGWQSMQDALVDMYMQEFTEQELNDMNAFYGSPTGRKVIKRLPVLVQMRNQVASARLQENIGELQYEIKARMEKEQKP